MCNRSDSNVFGSLSAAIPITNNNNEPMTGLKSNNNDSPIASCVTKKGDVSKRLRSDQAETHLHDKHDVRRPPQKKLKEVESDEEEEEEGQEEHASSSEPDGKGSSDYTEKDVLSVSRNEIPRRSAKATTPFSPYLNYVFLAGSWWCNQSPSWESLLSRSHIVPSCCIR